jgi:hypothetical protein
LLVSDFISFAFVLCFLVLFNSIHFHQIVFLNDLSFFFSPLGHSRAVFLHSLFQIGSLAVIGTLISMLVTFGAIMLLVHAQWTILSVTVRR